MISTHLMLTDTPETHTYGRMNGLIPTPPPHPKREKQEQIQGRLTAAVVLLVGVAGVVRDAGADGLVVHDDAGGVLGARVVGARRYAHGLLAGPVRRAVRVAGAAAGDGRLRSHCGEEGQVSVGDCTRIFSLAE